MRAHTHWQSLNACRCALAEGAHPIVTSEAKARSSKAHPRQGEKVLGGGSRDRRSGRRCCGGSPRPPPARGRQNVRDPASASRAKVGNTNAARCNAEL